uniref:Uncharacterized protein MANES_01G008600 n=1 Tax=Rhizophora mucronata TaxID=61149 RepID=A0A2P2IUG7_RHIMU
MAAARATATTTVTMAAAAVSSKIILKWSGARISMFGGPGVGMDTKLTVRQSRMGMSTTANANSSSDSAAANLTTTTAPPLPPAAESSSSSAEESDGKKQNLKDIGNMLDIRVGRIIRAWRHEEANSLYVEEVDVGESEPPRIICSGLVNYIPLHLLQGRKVVVLANLKARNMRGVKSNGMLMAASDASHQNVELLDPPEISVPGDRIWFGASSDFDPLDLPSPASPNQIQKKKVWETVQPLLKTDDSCAITLDGHFMRTSAGVVVCRSLRNASVS